MPRCIHSFVLAFIFSQVCTNMVLLDDRQLHFFNTTFVIKCTTHFAVTGRSTGATCVLAVDRMYLVWLASVGMTVFSSVNSNLKSTRKFVSPRSSTLFQD